MDIRRRIPLGLAFLLALGTAASAAGAVRLIGIRSAPRGTGLRIVLDLSGRAPCVLARVPGGEDWKVALRGLCASGARPALRDPHPLVSAIETRCEGRDLIVQIRARAPVRASGSWLAAARGRGPRYVIDVTPRPEARGAPPATPPPAAPDTVVTRPPAHHSGKWRILIDPGHGGDDPGAKRGNLEEKEIVLDVARRVARLLNASPSFEARLSRTDDRRIGLFERHQLADAFGADAFVSIHVNASRAPRAMGVEVFFLSLRGASDVASRELARSENAADPATVVEEDSLLQGIPFSLDLRQSDTLMRSSRLAEAVLTSFESSHLAASRGVKQAGFAVLKSFQVPSILVEVGFLSNPNEAKRLTSEEHRERLAECIARGMNAYFERFARGRGEPGSGPPQ